MNRTASQRLEKRTPLMVMELDTCGIDIAAISKTRLSGYDSMEDHGYVRGVI